VPLDGADADDELGGDVVVSGSPRDQPQDLGLTAGEPGERGRFGCRGATELGQEFPRLANHRSGAQALGDAERLGGVGGGGRCPLGAGQAPRQQQECLGAFVGRVHGGEQRDRIQEGNPRGGRVSEGMGDGALCIAGGRQHRLGAYQVGKDPQSGEGRPCPLPVAEGDLGLHQGLEGRGTLQRLQARHGPQERLGRVHRSLGVASLQQQGGPDGEGDRMAHHAPGPGVDPVQELGGLVEPSLADEELGQPDLGFSRLAAVRMAEPGDGGLELAFGLLPVSSRDQPCWHSGWGRPRSSARTPNLH
jgi:hypothetical protein